MGVRGWAKLRRSSGKLAHPLGACASIGHWAIIRIDRVSLECTVVVVVMSVVVVEVGRGFLCRGEAFGVLGQREGAMPLVGDVHNGDGAGSER